MARRFGWVVGGVLGLAGFSACASEPLSSPSLNDDEPRAGVSGSTSQGGSGARGSTPPNGGSAVGDADSDLGNDAGGGSANGGTGGQSMCNVEMGEGGDLGIVPGLTDRVPVLPFLLESYEDPTGASCGLDCARGPWTLQLEPRDGGGFDGVLVALDGSTASKVKLEPEGDHYRFADLENKSYVSANTVLAQYEYAWWVTAGLWVDDETKLQLIDETGDCVADRVRISGVAGTVGLISADFGGDTESYPIDIEAVPFDDTDPAVAPKGNDDPLHPLVYAPELLASGTATLADAQGHVLDAEPLTVGPVIYGFRATAALKPGSQVVWHIHGEDLAGRSRDRDVAATLRDWPLITDGTFETAWPQSIVLTRNDPMDDAVDGAYSLELQRGGSSASFRLAQPAGTTRLRFLASAKLPVDPDAPVSPDGPLLKQDGIVVEYAVPGGPVLGAALTATATSCADYPAFCEDDGGGNAVSRIFDFSLDVPESGEAREVLLRFVNHNFDYGIVSMPILVDQLRFE